MRLPTSAHGIYRSADGRRAVAAWCRRELGDLPEPRHRPAVPSPLGATAAWSVSGGPRTPVVVLAGTNFNAATTIPTALRLAADRSVHLVDLPGQPGLSDARRPAGDRMAAYGRWLDDVLPRLTDRPVLVLGHSLGAAVALSATPSPLIAGLLLLNPAGLAPALMSVAMMRASLPWMLAPSETTSARLLHFMSGPDGHREAAGAQARWLALVGRHCRTSLAPGPLPAHAVARWRATPVRVATGSHDRFYPPSRLTGPARRLLGAEVDTLPAAGHLALDESTDRLRNILRDLDGGED